MAVSWPRLSHQRFVPENGTRWYGRENSAERQGRALAIGNWTPAGCLGEAGQR
jgi:hypothetical protein